MLAIKRGEIFREHDSQLFFTAVNSDKHFFRVDERNPDSKELLRKDTQA